MPITTETYGRHENTHVITFGTGDIMMTKMTEPGSPNPNVLCFSEVPGKSIGEVSYDFEDKSSDELPNAHVIMRFDNPESILALIHSLCELQKYVFDNLKAAS